MDIQNARYGHTKCTVWTYKMHGMDIQNALYGHTKCTVWTYKMHGMDIQNALYGHTKYFLRSKFTCLSVLLCSDVTLHWYRFM